MAFNSLYSNKYKTLKKDKIMIQILHQVTIDSGHWFTVSEVDCKDGQVNWFDSLFGDLNVDTERQIAQ